MRSHAQMHGVPRINIEPRSRPALHRSWCEAPIHPGFAKKKLCFERRGRLGGSACLAPKQKKAAGNRRREVAYALKGSCRIAQRNSLEKGLSALYLETP